MATKTRTEVKAHTYHKTEEAKPIDIHEELKKALDRQEECKFDVATLVHRAFTEPEANGKFLHENKGFKTFREYIEGSFGLEYRNTMYYNQIGEVLTKTGISKEQIAKVGWSKFKEITRLFYDGISKNELEQILKAVDKLTVRDVREFVDKQRTERVGGTIVTKLKKVFEFTDDQIGVVNSTIKKAMDVFGYESESMALEAILVAWSGEFDETDEVAINTIKKKVGKEVKKEDKKENKPARKPKADKGKKVASKKK